MINLNEIIENNEYLKRLVKKTNHSGCFDENGKEVSFSEIFIDICAYDPKGYTLQDFCNIKTKMAFELMIKPLWEAAQIRKRNIRIIETYNNIKTEQYKPSGRTAKFQLSAKEQACLDSAVEKGLLKKENKVYTFGDGINKSVIIFFLSRLFCGDYEKDGIWYIARKEKLPNKLLCKLFNQKEMTALRNKSEVENNDWKQRKMPYINIEILQSINEIIENVK